MTTHVPPLTKQAGPPEARLRLLRPANPAAALGLATSHLMTKPAFAQLRFGAWSRVLVGQVNRGHYRLVVDGDDRVRGFLGWALCSEAAAEAWMAGRDVPSAEAHEGDCILFNAWSADMPAVHRLVLEAARTAMLGRRLACFRRVYSDGTSRTMRMPVNAFVDRKLTAVSS